MAEQNTPRSVIKRWLRGEPPPQPLLMPILFSLGSRLEGVPLSDFQSNPTKIANALRQIRATLKVDGVSCYFDPFLEAEALGCKREWLDSGSCRLAGPASSNVAILRKRISLDTLGQQGNIRVACDVLQRLRLMLKDDPALMVSLTGPCTLASQLVSGGKLAQPSAPRDLVEFASEVTAAICRSFLEAGADVILLLEGSLPEMPSDAYEWWASLLSPILNVIQFYEALPLVCLSDGALASVELASVLSSSWSGVWCPVLPPIDKCWEVWQSHVSGPCLGLPLAQYAEGGNLEGDLAPVRILMGTQKPLILTSGGDVPLTADMKNLATLLNSLRQAVSAGSVV